jgi:hypothetical protein
MKKLTLLILCFLSLSLTAQKKVLVESQEEVKTLASADFEKSMAAPEGELYLFGKANNIAGIYDFKVTIGDRGKVVSIFVLNREGGTIPMQNKVKDAVKETKFSFKLPKNKDYSLEYKFIF